MLNVLFAARPARWDEYKGPLTEAFAAADLRVNLSCDHAPADTDYIVFAPNGPVSDFAPYVKTKAVMSLWAGVETIVGNNTLTQPLCRMVDESLTNGMVEWVTGHTLRHHLGMSGTACAGLSGNRLEQVCKRYSKHPLSTRGSRAG